MPVEMVDATVFLGMNSTDEDTRSACASFFARRIAGRLAISLEQVGKCDDVIWGYSRRQQDAYYPFMDNLHTDLEFDRIGYDDQDVAACQDDTRALTVADRLLLAMAANRGAMLYTLNPRLLACGDDTVRRPGPAPSGRALFPDRLEALYQDSLALRIDLDQT